MNSPYSDQPKRAFWKSAVEERASFDPGDVYQPKFMISRKSRFVTAGSCFAQHVGRALRTVGLDVIDAEPLPIDLPDAVANRFGYNLYSARYGNIYTPRQMLQLLHEAFGDWTPEHPVWEKEGRFFDALRPSVEPQGFASAEDVLAARKEHLAAVREVFSGLDIFVFTLGLTEAWCSRGNGTVYPTCPGTIAGTFEDAQFVFHNFKFHEIYEDFLELRRFIKVYNPKVRFVLTVSPVPLTATATTAHVEVASSYSKSVLRAAAGALSDRLADVDYFPSYEIITSQAVRGSYYERNLRNVAKIGVNTAMSLFLDTHDLQYNARRAKILRDKKSAREMIKTSEKPIEQVEQEICEESLLQVFAK